MKSLSNKNQQNMKSKKFMISAGVAAVLMTLPSSCRENEFGTVDLSDSSDSTVTATFTYSHPVALYTAADFARVKAGLANGTAPDAVKTEFNNLVNNRFTQPSYKATPLVQIVRGDSKGTIYTDGKEHYAEAMNDAAAAYQLGLLWQLTGNEDYAKQGVDILNQWAATCTAVTSNDANHVLAAGAQGFTFALAGEELRTYGGWAQSQFEAFKAWMVRVFASVNKEFLDNHGKTTCGPRHYWANWDLVSLCSYFQIGILTENNDMVNFVINYFTKSGVGNGNINYLCIGGPHTDPLGSGETLLQSQESGRDQGHATMSCAVAIQLCQAAWALYQGNPAVTQLDFYGANDNAILKMAEFVALTNMRDGTDHANAEGAWTISQTQIPWTTVGPWCTGNDSHEASKPHTQFSVTGRGTTRPGWETLYQHYRAQGIGATVYAKRMADKIRPEGGAGDNRYGSNSSAFDQIGWGTLMMYQ